LLQHERHYWDSGIKRIAGVDEAGRGPLAGPVVAASVVFEQDFLKSEENGSLRGLTDSKLLTEKKRESFFTLLTGCDRVFIGVGMSGVDEIDSINILKATHLAMARSLSSLPFLPDLALVDGLPVRGLPCPSVAIVRGDSASLSIAAASIIAKVTRDRLMREYDLRYPGYGFAQHKGYGSKNHMMALFELGPSPLHRITFRPVHEAAEIRKRKNEDSDRID